MSTATTPLPTVHLPLAELLPKFELFSDLTPEELRWFIDHVSDLEFEEGTLLAREGEEVMNMSFILEGELRYQSSEPGWPVFIARAGQATGVLPFSRLRRYNGDAYATTRLRAAQLHRDLFPDLLREIPRLVPRLVGIMSDRIRENTRLVEQREKLKALGKLAAGLAHELNNPASATQRSAYDLRQWTTRLRDSNQALADHRFDSDQFRCLFEIERIMLSLSRETPVIGSLERSDRVETLSAWLKTLDVARPWELAPVFVDAGVNSDRLADVAACFSPESVEAVFTRLAAALTIESLIDGIGSSAAQISDLVSAVKGYSFVDQAPAQEVDIQSGLEDTLSILGHRLHKGITVVREYDQSLPRIQAHGSELNQVWTNLIENAIDAMSDSGELRIRATHEAGMALVEIRDNGKGIPPEIKDRIFDPFFTTKDVGAGRGLGLDAAFRIVQKHRGDMRFTSQPGDTCFQVRLPLHASNAF
jgi:signal transduction histidine kinase